MFYKCDLVFQIKNDKKIMFEYICAHTTQKARKREVTVSLSVMSKSVSDPNKKHRVKVTLQSRELQNIFFAINLLWPKEAIKASIEEINAEFNYEAIQPHFTYQLISMVEHSSLENLQPFYRNILENYKTAHNTFVDYRIAAAATEPNYNLKVMVTVISPNKPLSGRELAGLTSAIGNLVRESNLPVLPNPTE